MDREKFRSLVHYVCWRCADDPAKLGRVKLNKILWLTDFTSYYETGKPMTGARYVKRQFGPVPSAIELVLKELEESGAISIGESLFHGYKKSEFIVRSEPPAQSLTESEARLVNDVVNFVCDKHTAQSISDLSHDHIWRSAVEGEEIPYFTIFANPGQITEEEREWARLELQMA